MSNSIIDILGYQPEEVVGKSCWEYFHPDEIPFARAIHGRGVQLDKAAVLNYCQVKNRDGLWVGCECVFTVVHDVLVASTSIYRRGQKSESMSTKHYDEIRFFSLLMNRRRARCRSSYHTATFFFLAARSSISHALLHIVEILPGT